MARQTTASYSKKHPISTLDPKGVVEIFTVGQLIVNGDSIRVGKLPAGLTITDLEFINPVLATTTVSIGFEPVDTTPAENATYWFNANVLTAASRKSSAARPLVLTEDVNLIVTVAGADLTAVTTLDIIVKGKGHGAP